jgi:hypothetical protein
MLLVAMECCLGVLWAIFGSKIVWDKVQYESLSACRNGEKGGRDAREREFKMGELVSSDCENKTMTPLFTEDKKIAE